MAKNNVIEPFNATGFGVASSCGIRSAVTSMGLFNFTRNPLRYPFPLLTLQIGITIILLAFVRRILKPLKQPRFVAEILTGILISPSTLRFLDKNRNYASLFTFKQSHILGVLDVLCFAAMSFITGIRTDLSVIKSSGKLSWTIGLLNFALPTTLTLIFARTKGTIDEYAMARTKGMTDEYYAMVNYQWTSILASSTSFPVILILLEDLNLLNSEIGRRALSSALISNVCGYIFMIYRAFAMFGSYSKFETPDYIKREAARLALVLLIIFGLRPLFFRLIKKIPEGKSISESQFLTIFLTFLGVVFYCEILGYNGHFGGMILGLAIQSGPPLGSGVVKKLEFFVYSVLLPAYIINAGRLVDLSEITLKTYRDVEVAIILAFIGKLAASVVPSLICKIPYQDSFTFGLILSNQGLWDVLLFKNAVRGVMITTPIYSVLTFMTVINSAVVTPIISCLYDPSKRYINYRRRTIQHSENEAEFRILLCIHEEYQVFTLMNVLKASHPTQDRPIGAFVLDLVELVGRNQPLFINHQLHKRPSYSESETTRTDRIINAFRQYEHTSEEGAIRHQHFTTIAPFATIHDDICTLALDKSASLLILPFHKSQSLPLKNATRNVLEKAPCSVGILVDKKIISHSRMNATSTREGPNLSICVVFVGRADSREALTYGIRMVQNPSVRLTVVRLTPEEETESDFTETKVDLKIWNDLRLLNEVNERITVREIVVGDGAGTMKALLSMEDHFDFILVGRRLKGNSPLVSGLSDWSYEKELGILGDILASSDMKSEASVLVLQQQVTIEDLMRKK